MLPSALPIFELKGELLAALEPGARVILHAPTGSGKSTQVPQIMLEAGMLEGGECVVLQPRRLAARMLAARVAQERGVRLGEEVGYQVRLDRVAGPRTKIRYVTEGVLLRQMVSDPRLRGVSVVVFDEFHERHLYGDISLARALDIQETARPDLRVIVMSATLDASGLEAYMAPAKVLRSEGRMHPVAVEYLDRPARFEDYPVWDLAADTVNRLYGKTEGDFLVFMPGAYEISRTVSALRALKHPLVVLPLQGELSAAEQDAAVARYDRRKAVVATNVAETSITIEGVRTVVDSGLAKIGRFDPRRGINTLLVEKISRASADQRAGRAGRTAPGLCARLWTEREHEERPPQETPEVRRLDLAEVLLTLKAAGVADARSFRWLEAPERVALERAEMLLRDLGAADEGGAITEIGRRLLAFPVHPRYGRMLLAAGEMGCVRPAAMVAALTQGRPILQRSEGKRMDEMREEALGCGEGSDLFQLMRAYKYAENARFDAERCRRLGIHAGAAREAQGLFGQFLTIAEEQGLDMSERPADDAAIRKCVLAAFSDQVAVRLDRGTLRCALVHGRRGVLARESAAGDSPLAVVGEIRELEVKGELTTLLGQATAIEEGWLSEMFPGDVREEQEVEYDPAQKRVVARRTVKFRDLILRSGPGGTPDPDLAAAVFEKLVMDGTLRFERWDETVEDWIARVNGVCAWMPELGLPGIGDEARAEMVRQLCYGAVTAKELREKPVMGVVRSWLSKAQQDWVEKFAPERIELPSGKKWRIRYAGVPSPTVAARIQELYGVEGKLFIAGGRVPLVIQILAPNQRPVQVTSDLTTFWREGYPKVKGELQRKYPRHEWR